MMNDLISRQDILDILNKCYADIELDYDRPVNCYEGMFYTRLKMAFESAQPVQSEITGDQVIEYCRKRHLAVLDAAFYHELFGSYTRQCADRLVKEGD